ncbi:MAG: response regulator [Candidatus Berkelbacteria bacterium]|nr:response regulator [Candidatus Berkelbacteria bacterium]
MAKILVVDDSPALLELYDFTLSSEGHKVETAKDGEDGIKKLATFKPDLLLLDILMPNKDGFEVLKEIREDEKTKDLPVLLLTNVDEQSKVEQGLKLGATDYIVKFQQTPNQVVEEIRQVLQKIGKE